MIDFSIDSNKLVARFSTITDEIIKKTKQAADTGADQVRAQAEKSVNRTSPGSRDGVRRKEKKEVKIAPKGQPPNSDTGNLARNIKLSTSMGTAMRGKAYYAVVESIARSKKEYNYAKKLEETHPYMAPALKKSEKTIKRLFKNAVKID
jgi:hypothetical protein